MHFPFVCMDRWTLLGILLLVHTVDVGGYVTSNHEPRDQSMAYLNIAAEMITKAKNNYPICKPVDCEEVLRSQGATESGVYTVWPRNRETGDGPLDVYCDLDTDGGGWLVVQRRGNFSRPNDYFFKDWKNYKKGFGSIHKDFWLGNDNIFALTNQRLYSIRFDLKAVDGEKRYALYDMFWIDNEKDKYTLHIEDYSGNAGDAMGQYNNVKFSTKDQDNHPDNTTSISCALTYKGGRWYKQCYHANLNGLSKASPEPDEGDGITWRPWRKDEESLDTTEMKIRPKSFTGLKKERIRQEVELTH